MVTDAGLTYTLHEIHITEVWIQPVHVYDLGNESCAPNYELTEKGECKREYLQWHIYPLRLMSEMPPQCDMRALGCVLDTGIYIINGKQGARPQSGGCSILYHEILHIVWLEVFPNPEDAHKFFKVNYPNEECSVVRN